MNVHKPTRIVALEPPKCSDALSNWDMPINARTKLVVTPSLPVSVITAEGEILNLGCDAQLQVRQSSGATVPFYAADVVYSVSVGSKSCQKVDR